LITPVSVAIDDSLNVYVVDQGALGVTCSDPHAASIMVFAKPDTGPINRKPIRRISGCNTQLTTPTDIKINNKKGLIYVADQMKVLVFPILANGTPSPNPYYTSQGAITGIGIVPYATSTPSPAPTSSSAARRLGPKSTTEKHP
jgi:hypothetical protein